MSSAKKKRRASGEGSKQPVSCGGAALGASPVDAERRRAALEFGTLKRSTDPRMRWALRPPQTIKDAFGKQAAAAALPSLRAVLEVQHTPKVVPDVFLEEALKIHEVRARAGVRANEQAQSSARPCMPHACHCSRVPVHDHCPPDPPPNPPPRCTARSRAPPPAQSRQ
jgi:hypothetical protein